LGDSHAVAEQADGAVADDADVGLGGVEEAGYVSGGVFVVEGHEDDGALALAEGLDAVGEDFVIEIVFELRLGDGVEGFGAEPFEELVAAVGGAAEIEDHHAAGAKDEGFEFVGFAEAAGAKGLEGSDEDLLGEVIGGVMVAEMTEAVAPDARCHGAAELGLGFGGRGEVGVVDLEAHAHRFYWKKILRFFVTRGWVVTLPVIKRETSRFGLMRFENLPWIRRGKMSVQEMELKASINRPGEQVMRFFGVPTQIKASSESTGGTFALIESWEMPVGFSSPYHTHSREDESFYVLDGEMAFVVDGKWHRAGAGTFLFGPRNLAHGFKVVGNRPARMLLMASPGGFDSFVLELAGPLEEPAGPPEMAKVMEAAARFGMEVHGPLPEEPEDFASEGSMDLKGINHRWIDAFNARDWATERAARSDDFKAILSGTPEPLDNDAWSGFMQHFTAAFPDSRITVEQCVAEGDTVVSRWSLAGTHEGEFQGIPATGRAIKFAGVECNRVRDGRIVEHFAQFDLASLLKQLGVM
jgi:steroid delta-isomerase-like uncharacterized protein